MLRSALLVHLPPARLCARRASSEGRCSRGHQLCLAGWASCCPVWRRPSRRACSEARGRSGDTWQVCGDTLSPSGAGSSIGWSPPPVGILSRRLVAAGILRRWRRWSRRDGHAASSLQDTWHVRRCPADKRCQARAGVTRESLRVATPVRIDGTSRFQTQLARAGVGLSGPGRCCSRDRRAQLWARWRRCISGPWGA